MENQDESYPTKMDRCFFGLYHRLPQCQNEIWNKQTTTGKTLGCGTATPFLKFKEWGLRVRKMASAMLVLVVPPWPAARGLLRSCWELLQRKLQQSGPGFSSLPWGPALAVQGPAVFTEPADDTNGSKEIFSLSDSIFWMAAPKNRRSIEVNRCRRRNPQKLIKVKNNIDVCPECGHLKLKHVLCGYCYEKVCKETAEIRRQGNKKGALLRFLPWRLWCCTQERRRLNKIAVRESLNETGSDHPGSPRIKTKGV